MLSLFKKIFSIFKPAKLLNVEFDNGDVNKKTIVLLHGIAASTATWEFLIKEIGLNDYRVIGIDLLGFGKSPKPTYCDYSVDDHIKYLRKTLKKLSIKKPYMMIGHSMGAIITAKYCSLYKNDINHAYLLSMPLYVKNNSEKKNIFDAQTDMYMKAYDFMTQNKDFTMKYSQVISKLLHLENILDINEENWHSFRKSLKNTIMNQNTYEDIKKIDIPLRIIFGTLDEFLVQGFYDKLATTKNISITKIFAMNHSINLRYAKIIAKQIRKEY